MIKRSIDVSRGRRASKARQSNDYHRLLSSLRQSHNTIPRRTDAAVLRSVHKTHGDSSHLTSIVSSDLITIPSPTRSVNGGILFYNRDFLSPPNVRGRSADRQPL